jgi:tRNA(Ser,Leu) C12 N-acetylase TAN1
VKQAKNLGVETTMETWNVVITVHEGCYSLARQLLEPLGAVRKTDYFNVLVMTVADIQQAPETLRSMIDEKPEILGAIARFVPAAQTFFFTSAEEFEEKAQEAALSWVRELEGKKFYVRMKRRGFKKRISSLEEETFLDKILIETLEKRGASGTISFTDPDAVIVIETVGQRAGMTLFTKGELARFPFLHVD